MVCVKTFGTLLSVCIGHAYCIQRFIVSMWMGQVYDPVCVRACVLVYVCACVYWGWGAL